MKREIKKSKKTKEGTKQFGRKLEEVIKLKNKAKREYTNLSEEYPTKAYNYAKEVYNKLGKYLDKVDKGEENNPVEFANTITEILNNDRNTNLQNMKFEYETWKKVNSMLN